MPLILLGVVILIFALIIIPLLLLLISNPVGLALGLIFIGILWIIIPKLFYSIAQVIFNIFYFLDNKIFSKIRENEHCKTLNKKLDVISNVIDKPVFQRGLLYGIVIVATIFVIYIQYNPINN